MASYSIQSIDVLARQSETDLVSDAPLADYSFQAYPPWPASGAGSGLASVVRACGSGHVQPLVLSGANRQASWHHEK